MPSILFRSHNRRFSFKLNNRRTLPCPTSLNYDPGRARRPLVVRGYNKENDLSHFWELLGNSNLWANRDLSWEEGPTAELAGSLTFWLLVALGSPAVRPLHFEDSVELHKLADSLRSDPDWSIIVHVVKGTVTFVTLRTKTGDRNTLMPVVMAGDPSQLTPTVMAVHEVDTDGKPSPLEHFIRIGWPAWRCQTQRRGPVRHLQREVHNDLECFYAFKTRRDAGGNGPRCSSIQRRSRSLDRTSVGSRST